MACSPFATSTSTYSYVGSVSPASSSSLSCRRQWQPSGQFLDLSRRRTAIMYRPSGRGKPLPLPFPLLQPRPRPPIFLSFPVSAKQQQQQSSSKRNQSKKPSSSSSSSPSRESIAVAESRSKEKARSTNKRQDSSSRGRRLEQQEVVLPEILRLPSPPAGFVLNKEGRVTSIAPPNKRITTVVDSANGRSLECLIRRTFTSSDGRRCFLLCPLDTPVQVLRIDEEEGEVNEIGDKELEDIFPTASYELAKRRLHLVLSGFCLTMRGGFCFTEDDVMDLNTVYGEGVVGESSNLNEGVEVASFEADGGEYLVYTPLDPLMFVAYKDDKTGQLLLAQDDLLDDEDVLDAIDEEKEFQAYMDGEIAMSEDEEYDSE